jgi:hypothetical protein
MRLTDIFSLESAALDAAIRASALHKLFAPAPRGPELPGVYVRFLRVTAGYVANTVPMLRAAGVALAGGDDEDRAWSALFSGYGDDEIDPAGGYGHDVWAENDLRALGAPVGHGDWPECVRTYSAYFVDHAPQHPYAILGAKGVLEHLALRFADDLSVGVRASDIPGGGAAVSFLAHHGVLDVEHVRAGDANIERLRDEAKRRQVIHGAYVTSGSYRAFLRCV